MTTTLIVQIQLFKTSEALKTIDSLTAEQLNARYSNMRNLQLVTALHLACWTGQFAVVAKLIDKGADTNCLDSMSRSALHFAVLHHKKCTEFNDKLKVIELLLNNNPLLVDRQDQAGNSALHLATSLNAKQVIELLFKYNANPRVTNNDNLCPTALAVNKGNVALGGYLQEKQQNLCYLAAKRLKEDFNQHEIYCLPEQLQRQVLELGLNQGLVQYFKHNPPPTAELKTTTTNNVLDTQPTSPKTF